VTASAQAQGLSNGTNARLPAEVSAAMSKLTPRHVLADLFDGIDPPDGFELRTPNPEEAVVAVIQR